MKQRPLVTIAIPTKNSALFLRDCLKSIQKQRYKHYEVLIIDSHSVDDTGTIAKNFGAKIFQFEPRVRKGIFEAPYKRNYGANKAKGRYYYYLDADMRLQKENIGEAVKLCEDEKKDAVILSEDSFGKGIWAQAKNLERRCYWGDDTVEAPRFIRLSAWKKINGMDEKVGGGGDDWDLFQKLLESGYKVGRIKSKVFHNEGSLSLISLIKKRYMYGTQTLLYIQKRPIKGFQSYFPIRLAYIRHWKLFIARPQDTVVFIVMRTIEYLAGLAGIITGALKV